MQILFTILELPAYTLLLSLSLSYPTFYFVVVFFFAFSSISVVRCLQRFPAAWYAPHVSRSGNIGSLCSLIKWNHK